MASPLALLPLPRHRYWTQNGKDPLEGGVLQFFDVGTSTPKAVYADPQGAVSLGTEVELDAFGYAPAIYISATGGYRVVLIDRFGVQQWDVDGVEATGGGSLVGNASGEANHVVVTDGHGGLAETPVIIDPSGNMSGVGDFQFGGRLIVGPAAPTTIVLTGNLATDNDIALTNHTLFNLTNPHPGPSGWAHIGGFTGGVEGRVVYLRNLGPGDYDILGEHPDSAPQNRFVTDSLSIAYGQIISIMYNGAQQRWNYMV